MIIVVFNAFLMTFFLFDLFIHFSRLPYSVSNPPTLIPGIETTQNSNNVFDDDDDDSQEAFTNNDDINIVYSVDKSKI